MGRIIAKRLRGMNWMAKVSLILIFTLVFSTFMYQGLYRQQIAQAAASDVYLLWDGASGSPPAGWTYVATWNNSFIRGAATAGGTGGTATHTHTAGSFTLGAASTSLGGAAGAGNPSINHAHTVNTSSIGTGSNEPSNRTLVLIKRNAPATIPAGAIAMFDGTLPAGWTQYAAENGYYIKLSATAGTTGGNAGNQHTHSVTFTTPIGATTDSTIGAGTKSTPATTTHNHTLAAATSVAATYEPAYREAIFAKADADIALTSCDGLIALFDAAPPVNWASISGAGGAFENKFIKAAATYGGTGGGGTHTHAVTQTTGAASGAGTNGNNGSGAAALNTHTHSVDTTLQATTETDYTPPYINFIVGKYTVPGNLAVANGTNPADANAPRSSTNNALDGFTLAMSASSGTVSTLTVTGSANFTATNIPTNGVKIYRDAGTIGTYDSGTDTLISSSSTAISGNATTVTLSSAETVTTSAANYLVTVDINAGATLTNTFTGTVTAATGTGLGTPTYNDAASATLTVTPVQTLTFGDGTNPTNANAPQSSTNRALDGFTLSLTAGSGTVSTLTVTGSANFTATNIPTNGVKIYRDAGTLGVYDSGTDTLISSSSTAISGNATTVTLSSAETVTTSAANYLVTVDINAGATLTQTFTGTISAATGSGIGTPVDNDTGSATLTITAPLLPSTITSCAGCHTYPPTDGTQRNTTEGAIVGSHSEHSANICSTCHVAPATETSTDYGHRTGNIEMNASISGGTYSRGTSFAQTNSPTTGTCSTISCHGGNNPTPQWGVGTAGCVDCHNGVITRTQAAGTLDNVFAEFALPYGHKASGKTPARGAVTNADCIVCHLEGNYTTQKTSTYHADGNIDLRDPDGAGETPITDLSGAAFTFTKFSISYASRSNSPAANSIPDVITRKFCVACHDNLGATNTTARTSGGTAAMPFGGINLGGNYTVANGAMADGGLIDVKTQFATTNSSVHPVLGPRNKSHPTSARLVAPYNNQVAGRVDAGPTKTDSVVMNCFDCHTTNASQPTTRTISAHGNAAWLRGTLYVASPTLCLSCHASYDTTAANHGAGSAWTSATANQHNTALHSTCNGCHASATTKPARPIPAQDYHGSDRLAGSGADALWPVGATETSKPYAFIRNTVNYTTTHRPLRGIGGQAPTAGSAVCATTATGIACDTGYDMSPVYTPGGTY